MADLNGRADPFAQHVADLIARREREDATEAQLRAQLLGVQDRKRRLNKAIDALSDRSTQAKPAPKKTRGSSSNDWRPSPERMTQVLDTLAQGPGSVSELSERSGLSKHIVRNAVNALREEERVRLAGKAHSEGVNPRGLKASIYALMETSDES